MQLAIIYISIKKLYVRVMIPLKMRVFFQKVDPYTGIIKFQLKKGNFTLYAILVGYFITGEEKEKGQ